MILTLLPTIPDSSIIEYQMTITPFTTSADSISMSTSTGIHTIRYLVIGVPVNYVVCGTNICVLSQFTGSGLSSLTCSLGAFNPNNNNDSILTDLNYYGLATELTQVPTSETFSLSGPPNNDLTVVSSVPVTGLYFNGVHDISAYFVSTGATLSTLTAGAVGITVQLRSL